MGEAAVCGPSNGCETVAASTYSEVLGVPVAVFGVAFSLVLVGCALAWWRRGERRAVLAAYLLLLFGTAVVAYLTYLELFVIDAICAWCVAYAASILGSLGVAGLVLRRS
jgi:uncharacterized membrane protein